VTFSDHRPVSALFELTTHKISHEKALQMEESYFKKLSIKSRSLILTDSSSQYDDLAPKSHAVAASDDDQEEFS
jgi:hypothetical protein